MKAVFDSSSFAKQYIVEPGSEQVEAILQSTSQLGLSVLCVPEIVSALNRRLREEVLREAENKQVKGQWTHCMSPVH